MRPNERRHIVGLLPPGAVDDDRLTLGESTFLQQADQSLQAMGYWNHITASVLPVFVFLYIYLRFISMLFSAKRDLNVHIF